MKQNRRTRIAAVALLAALGTVSAMPAHAVTKGGALKRAQTEIQALKQELAEQRALINKLLATQNTQKEAIENIETRSSAQPSEQQPSAQMGTQAAGQQPPAQVGTLALGQRPLTEAESTTLAKLLKGFSMYGTLDVNVANTDSGYGHKTTVGSSGMTASSIGIKAQKEVREGLRVVGELEMGLDLSTGVVANGPITNGVNDTVPSSGGFTGTGNQIFSRQAYAGLGSDMLGQLTLGRQYASSYLAAAIEGNAFGPGFYGSSATFLPVIGGMPTRVNNAIVYRTPSFAGFSAYATYTAGSENNVNETIVSGTSRVTDSSGEGGDIGVFYRSKTLTAAVTAWDVQNAAFAEGETDLATKKGWQAVANYDFGFAKFYATYVYGEISGGNYENVTKILSEADGWSVSAKVPYGNHAIIASYAELNDKSLLDRDGSLFGLGYTYKLADATWLYVSYGKQFNDNNGTYSLMNGGDLVGSVVEPGFDPEGIMIGLNTKF